jgi:hypothetical protein
MPSATHDLAGRFLQGVGLAECSLAVAEQRLPTYGRGMQLVAVTDDCDRALSFLSTLTWPASRYVAFAAAPQLTGIVNNSRSGSDLADDVVRMPRQLGCRFARVVNRSQRVWQQGKLRVVQQYGARIFALHDERGEPIRSIACINDGGRWVYHAAGEPHPIEPNLHPTPSRTSARFPAEQLRAVAAAYGFPLPTVMQFQSAARYLMLTRDDFPLLDTCSIEEADDPAYMYFVAGMGYVKFLETHAVSIVASFERCLAINPAYEPRVREPLAAARRRLDQQK